MPVNSYGVCVLHSFVSLSVALQYLENIFNRSSMKSIRVVPTNLIMNHHTLGKYPFLDVCARSHVTRIEFLSHIVLTGS